MLGHNVHGNLGKVKIGADSGCGCDSCGLQHIQDHFPGKFPGCFAGRGQVIGQIDKDLINGVNMDVFRCNVFQVQLVDPGALFHVEGHSGRRNDIVDGIFRMGKSSPVKPEGSGNWGPVPCFFRL